MNTKIIIRNMTRFTFIICSIQSKNIWKVQKSYGIQVGRGLNWKLTSVSRSMQMLQVFSSPGSLRAPLSGSSHRHEWDSITVPKCYHHVSTVAVGERYFVGGNLKPHHEMPVNFTQLPTNFNEFLILQGAV